MQEFSYPGQPYEYDDPKSSTSNEIHQPHDELLEAAKDALATFRRAKRDAFCNGVEHSGMDEGDVRAGQAIDRLRFAVAAVESAASDGEHLCEFRARLCEALGRELVLVDKLERLRTLIQALLDNDPDDMAADGVTVLQAWRKEACRALGAEQIGVDDLGNEWFRTIDPVS